MSTQEDQSKDKAFKSSYVWAAFGLLIIVFTVNYLFYSVAQTTTSGLVNEEYYKYGLQQNKIDKQYRKQAARGWQVQLNIPENWAVNTMNTISLHVVDKDGQAIEGGHAEITAYRPSDSKADVITHLLEKDTKGVYQGELALALPGVWDINLLFTSDGNKHMLNQRIYIKGDVDSEKSTLEKIVDFVAP